MPSSTRAARVRHAQSGFGLVELTIAILVLMVGIVAMAQLVPTSLDYNMRNRYNSTALIVAQRELEQMVRQSLTVRANGALSDYNFTDSDGAVCYLGALPIPATAPIGQAPPAATQTGCAATNGFIDFSQSCAATGYVRTVNVAGSNYEVRWNVVTLYGNDKGTIRPVNKRITISARSNDVRPLPPVSLSVLVGP